MIWQSLCSPPAPYLEAPKSRPSAGCGLPSLHPDMPMQRAWPEALRNNVPKMKSGELEELVLSLMTPHFLTHIHRKDELGISWVHLDQSPSRHELPPPTTSLQRPSGPQPCTWERRSVCQHKQEAAGLLNRSVRNHKLRQGQSHVHPEAIHSAQETDALLHPSLQPGPQTFSLSRHWVAVLMHSDQYPHNLICLPAAQIFKAFLFHAFPQCM